MKLLGYSLCFILSFCNPTLSFGEEQKSRLVIGEILDNELATRATTDVGIDLGDLEAGKAHSMSMRLVNMSSGRLELIKAKPQCGCTNLSIPQTSLSPGGSVDVKFTITPALNSIPEERFLVDVETRGYYESVVLRLECRVSNTLGFPHAMDTHRIHTAASTKQSENTLKVPISFSPPITSEMISISSSGDLLDVNWEIKNEENKWYAVSRIDGALVPPGESKSMLRLSLKQERSRFVEKQITLSNPEIVEISPEVCLMKQLGNGKWEGTCLLRIESSRFLEAELRSATIFIESESGLTVKANVDPLTKSISRIVFETDAVKPKEPTETLFIAVKINVGNYSTSKRVKLIY